LSASLPALGWLSELQSGLEVLPAMLLVLAADCEERAPLVPAAWLALLPLVADDCELRWSLAEFALEVEFAPEVLCAMAGAAKTPSTAAAMTVRLKLMGFMWGFSFLKVGTNACSSCPHRRRHCCRASSRRRRRPRREPCNRSLSW
jgi:hypothetical protein